MRYISVIVLALSISFASCKRSQDTTSACLKPPMGFNSYDSYNTYLNQETAVRLMDIMAEKYLPYGYEYFVIDAGWFTEYEIDPQTKMPLPVGAERLFNLDENGLPEPSRACFSNGMKVLADYAHKKGLKFGFHLMRGVIKQAIDQNCKVKGTDILIKDIVDTLSICTWNKWTIGVDMHKKGAAEYYNSLINKVAAWDIDFIKYDDITGMPEEINAITSAIKNCGRQIVLSLSPGEDTKPEFMPFYHQSNMLRITPDIWDNEKSINNGFTGMEKFQGLGIPGFWPDLDMLALGPLEVMKKTKRLCKLTYDQQYTLITQRAIFASPLIIGGDLLTMDDFAYSLITNRDMISCDQNGVTGTLTYNMDSTLIYKAVDRNDPASGWVAIFNRKKSSADLKVLKRDFGFLYNRNRLNVLVKNFKFEDIWNRKDYLLSDTLKLTLPADGVFFARYKEN